MDSIAGMVKKIDQAKDALIITWQDGAEKSFPHAWLRDNASDNWRSQFYGNEANSDGFALVPALRSVAVEYDETLVLVWSGAWEVTRHPLANLRFARCGEAAVELALLAD